MEVRLEETKTGNKRHRNMMVAVAFFAALLPDGRTDAQVLRIRSRGGSQQIVHSVKNEIQSFAPVRWDIQNQALDDGCLVQWTAENFAHKTWPQYQADCELSLRLVQGSRNARWNVSAAADSSNIASGKGSATVSITSRRSGTAEVELSVNFRHPHVVSLTAGSYQTLVTGTISGL
jgi:hypothetical protein